MPETTDMVSRGGASLHPLSAALVQLELTERELVSMQTSLGSQLDATREAIAAVRRATDASILPAPRVAAAAPAAAPISAPPRLKSGRGGAAAAASRERQILGLLEDGAKVPADLRASIVPPAGCTDKQHRLSIQNALGRMRMKGLVTAHADGWVLTARGRKAAAVKEEP